MANKQIEKSATRTKTLDAQKQQKAEIKPTPKQEQKVLSGAEKYLRVAKTIKLDGKKDKGVSKLSSGQASKMRLKTLETIIHRTGKFELFWYPIFFIGGLICLLLVKPFTALLVSSVMCLWISMVGNNLTARGYRIGLLINSAQMVIYIIISAITKVWGEVLINALMYLPIEILGFIQWGKVSTEKEAQIDGVKYMSVKNNFGVAGIFAGMAAVVFVILQFVVKQNYAYLNAISISAFVVGGQLRNRQKIETWFYFMMGNLAGISLWLVTSLSVDLSVLPLMLSFASTLSNNFNGLAIWQKIYKHNQKTQGRYLAMREVNITGIAKLKTNFKKMKGRG